jgi:hypothetical protein
MISTSNETAIKLSYRIFIESDLEKVLELWEKNSGWGAITRQQFYEWHMNTPYGNCMIIVAEDALDGVIGQMIFVPSKVYIDGGEKNAYRVMAPIIKNDFREFDIKHFDHPAYAMFRFGIQEAKKNDHEIIYFLPSLGWVAAVKTFPKYGLPAASIAINDCLRIKRDTDNIFPNEHLGNYYLQSGHFNEEYEQLWDDAIVSLSIQCAVVRHSKWLKWKRAPHILFEMRNKTNHQLKGYIVIKKDSGLVVDLLARSIEEMESVVRLTVQWVHQNNADDQQHTFTEIKLMQTPFINKVLNSISHDKIDFRFAFVYYFLDGQMQNNKEWFIMPDD